MVSLVLRPDTLEEAIDALHAHGEDVKVIAGGTAVVLMLQNRLIAPDVLLSLGRIAGLDAIREDPDGSLRIGALVTLREVERSAMVWKRLPMLAATYGTVANVRVRNAATVGGNLVEADYASDPPCALVALRARILAVGPNGARAIPAGELFTGFFETALQPDEIVTELIVPPLEPGSQATYLKFKSRGSEDRPCVGVAAVARHTADGTCAELRVVIGAADEIPRELPDVEALASGHVLDDSRIDRIAEGYAAGIEPISDVRGSAWYRKEMIRVHVRRALTMVRSAQ